MLETKPQPVGRTARSATARAVPARSALSERAARPTERAARRAAVTQSSRVARSETRLLTWTVTWAIVVCGLLVLYLAAYAHVTLLGIDQAKMKHELNRQWQTNQLLRAQEASLKSPDRISARAVALGMTKDSPRVDYIAPPLPASEVQTAPPAPIALGDAARTDAFSDRRVTMKVGGEADSLGTDSGPTTNDNSAAHND